MAPIPTKAALKTETDRTEQAIKSIDHSDVAVLAYQLWQDRGCPEGSPEEDWYNAEQQLKSKKETAAAR